MIVNVKTVGINAEKLLDTLDGTLSGILIFNLSCLPSQVNNSTDKIAINIPKNNPLVSV